MLLSSSDTKRTLQCIYLCLQIPARENRFQYVRRVYATAINFPCIITLSLVNLRVAHAQDCRSVTVQMDRMCT